MTSHLISIALIMALAGSEIATLPVMALNNDNSLKLITIQDKYGNTQGFVKRIGNTHYESDKYGNAVRTYKQIGNIIYIYDKYGNCVGSFRK